MKYRMPTLVSLFSFLSHRNDYATKNKKTVRKNISTKKIFIINHLLEDMLFRYFNKAPCAPSTFANVSSMFSSILKIKYLYQPHPMSQLTNMKAKIKHKSDHHISYISIRMQLLAPNYNSFK